jgi:hypothetical protein
VPNGELFRQNDGFGTRRRSQLARVQP